MERVFTAETGFSGLTTVAVDGVSTVHAPFENPVTGVAASVAVKILQIVWSGPATAGCVAGPMKTMIVSFVGGQSLASEVIVHCSTTSPGNNPERIALGFTASSSLAFGLFFSLMMTQLPFSQFSGKLAFRV